MHIKLNIIILCFRRLEAIAKDRLPQILSIQHSDDEEARCDEEEDGCGAMRSDSSNEEHEEEKKCDNQDAASLDFSFQSLSPGENFVKLFITSQIINKAVQNKSSNCNVWSFCNVRRKITELFQLFLLFVYF